MNKPSPSRSVGIVQVANSILDSENFFMGIDDSQCDKIHAFLTATRCLDDVNVGKQSVA